MRDVALEELPVAGDALVEVLRRNAFARVGLRRRAVAPRIHHHAQLVADIEPDLRLIGRQAEDVHVLGLQVAHVGLGERARLADLRRYGAPGRVNRDAAQKYWTAIQMELPVPNLEGTEADADGLGPHGFPVLGRRDLKLVEHGRVRAPELGLQAGNRLGERGPFGRARSGLPQRTLPKKLAVAGLRNDPHGIPPRQSPPPAWAATSIRTLSAVVNASTFSNSSARMELAPKIATVKNTSCGGDWSCPRNLRSFMLRMQCSIRKSRNLGD